MEKITFLWSDSKTWGYSVHLAPHSTAYAYMCGINDCTIHIHVVYTIHVCYIPYACGIKYAYGTEQL